MAQNGGYEDMSENAGMAEESFSHGYQQSGGLRTQRYLLSILGYNLSKTQK